MCAVQGYSRSLSHITRIGQVEELCYHDCEIGIVEGQHQAVNGTICHTSAMLPISHVSPHTCRDILCSPYLIIVPQLGSQSCMRCD